MHAASKSILAVVLVGTSFAGGFLFGSSKRKPMPEGILPISGEGLMVHIFFPVRKSDPDGMDSLVAVERVIPLTSVVDEVIERLLTDSLTATERGRGLYNPFFGSPLIYKGSMMAHGTLRLAFEDPKYFTSGGSTKVSNLWRQIVRTSKQFPNVTNVQHDPEDLFQP